MEKVQDDT